MFTKTLIAAAAVVVLAATGPAQAAEAYGYNYADNATAHAPDFMSTLSRMQVRDAAIAARAAHRITDYDIDQTPSTFVTLKSRAQVQAEAVEALRLGVASQTEAGNFATVMQLESIEMAGLRAAGMVMAAR